MNRAFVLAATAFWFLSAATAQTGEPLLFDLTSLRHKPSEVTTKANTKAPVGTVELVEGQFGKACKFSFVEAAGPPFFTAWVNPADDWNQYAGFSFYVKGDGSRNCGGLELIDGENYALRYGYCFPIESTDWVKVTVAWSDLMPEIAGPLVDTAGGYAPGRFRNVWFGKWGYWREFPACSFAIERMALEKTIERPAVEAPAEPGLPRLLARLKARQPVTVVTMGDSLSDKRHWANREKLWSELLVKRLKDCYGGEVRLVNPAIGGTTLSQNTVLIPRWIQETPSPDLVTIWFGYNDWDSGVRKERFKQYMKAAVDRVRRATKGRAEILLMTSCPAYGRWETLDTLCQAAYEVAKECKTGFADTASAFHKAGSPEEAMKRQYWAWDKVHLGPAGHDLVADTVFAAIGSKGLADLGAAPNASWMKASAPAQLAEGETPLSSFEPGQDDLVRSAGGKIVAEHATDGKHALRLVSLPADYAAMSIEDGRALRLVRENSRVLVDVFNPQDGDVFLGVSVRDPESKDFNSRYNGSVTVKPGKSTIDFDYTRLARSGTAKNATPDFVRTGQIMLIVFFLDPRGSGRPVTLFFDNVRLASAPAGKAS